MEQDVIDTLNERLDNLVDKVRAEYRGSELEAKITELRAKLEDTVVNNPVQSLAAGVLIGIVIGKILSQND